MQEVKEDKMDLEIIIKDGQITKNNFPAYKAYALGLVKPADKELITAQDLTAAKAAVKLCEQMEIRIANAAIKIQHKPEIQAALDELAKMGEELRQIRLRATKRIAKRGEDDKAKIVNDGYNKVLAIWNVSPAKHGFTVEKGKFLNAIKGKSSLAKMEEAVQALVEKEQAETIKLEDNYQSNIGAVEISEQTYPTSYPDKRTICLQSAEVVAQTIETREAKAKLAAIEKANREAKEKAEQEEAERLRIEKARAAEDAAEKARLESWDADMAKKDEDPPETVQPTSPAPFTPPPAEDPFVADAGGFTMPPAGFSDLGPKKQTLLMELVVVSDSIQMIMSRIKDIPGVKELSYQVKQE